MFIVERVNQVGARGSLPRGLSRLSGVKSSSDEEEVNVEDEGDGESR